MGLFNKNKQVILRLPEKCNKDFIYSVSAWTTEVKLNTKIIVPQGWWCIFVTKDKPCDVLEAGEHLITLDKIPLVTKLLKLQKPMVQIKRGKKEKVYRESFKSFVYFVNKSSVPNLAWQTDNIVLKKKNAAKNEKKRFDVVLSGVADLRCTDPAAMMKFYLYEWAKVDSFKAQNRACEYAGEIVQDIVRKIRVSTPQEIDDLNNITGLCLPEIEKEFGKYGMVLENFAVTKVIFDREVAAALLQEKMEKDIASDEINELGAEISVLDDKAVKESKRHSKKENVEALENVEVLDMTDDEAREKDVEELKNKMKQDVDDVCDVSDKDSELPKITLNTENVDKK